MMVSIKNWILSIVSIMIFSTLADIILPKGNLKRLSKLVIGFIVIIVILNPILSLINNKGKISNSIGNYVNSMEFKHDKLNQINDNYNTATIEAFKQNLSISIEQSIKRKFNEDYKVLKLDLNQDQKSNGYLAVRLILLTKKEATKDTTRIKISNINHDIGTSNTYANKKIAWFLSREYKIDSNFIKFVR